MNGVEALAGSGVPGMKEFSKSEVHGTDVIATAGVRSTGVFTISTVLDTGVVARFGVFGNIRILGGGAKK